MNIDLNNIPEHIKQLLLDLADKVPPNNRADFMKNILSIVGEYASKHPNTLFYSVLGLVIGETLDNILTFNIPVINEYVQLSGDKLGQFGFIAGSVKGLFSDKRNIQRQDELSEIIIREVQKAMKLHESVVSTQTIRDIK